MKASLEEKAQQASPVVSKGELSVSPRNRNGSFAPCWQVVCAIPWEAEAESRQIIDIGPQVVSALGYPRERWFESGFWEAHLDPQDQESTVRRLERAISETDRFDLEYQFVTANGSTRWFRDNIRVIRDDNGTPSKLLGLMMDIDRLKTAELRLRERLVFEEQLARLSGTLINLPPDQVDQEIEKGLEVVATAFGSDRASFAQFDAACCELRVTHSWSTLGISPVPKQSVKELFPWIYEQLQQGNKIVVSGVQDFPATAEKERQYALAVGQKATLILPFRIGGKVAGSLAIGCLQRERDWEPDVIQSFQLAAEIFANAIRRKQTEEGLKQASLEIKALKDRLQGENLYVREEVQLDNCNGEVIANSEAMRHVFKRVAQVAVTDSTVLLLGETGTGKELLAGSIHGLSRRRERRMVKVNCAALPPPLVESELFGREKGAYTGALTREIGRFELAHESTIFLDEIGELTLDLQAKLLRVLQEGEFERLGSPRTIHVNVRVIAATSRNLSAAIKEGRFREDLFYRLNVFPIRLPPLRDP